MIGVFFFIYLFTQPLLLHLWRRLLHKFLLKNQENLIKCQPVQTIVVSTKCLVWRHQGLPHFTGTQACLQGHGHSTANFCQNYEWYETYLLIRIIKAHQWLSDPNSSEFWAGVRASKVPRVTWTRTCLARKVALLVGGGYASAHLAFFFIYSKGQNFAKWQWHWPSPLKVWCHIGHCQTKVCDSHKDGILEES